MKLSSNSTVSVDALKGALVTNEHGAEFKCIGLAIMITTDNLLEPILHVMAYDEEGEETLEGLIGLIGLGGAGRGCCAFFFFFFFVVGLGGAGSQSVRAEREGGRHRRA